MRTRLIPLALTSLILLCLAAPGRAGVYPELWERYYQLFEDQSGAGSPAEVPPTEVPPAEPREFMGRILGEWAEPPRDLFQEPWPQREVTYEILAADNALLARSIYGLALFTHDLDQSVDLGRFERGAQGFHYSLGQITDWANAVLSGDFPLYAAEELLLLGRLVEDGVLTVAEGSVTATGKAAHVLGAAAGSNRSLALNLNHERLHVVWEESPAFSLEWRQRWRDLSDEEREAVFADLSGYDRENVEGVIEEWAVRRNEAEAVW